MATLGFVKIKLDLSATQKDIKRARALLANQVLIDCRAIMPLDTGSLQSRSYVTSDNKSVVFPGPYARYLYYGNKMVNAKTGKGPALIRDKYGNIVGYRYRKGTKLKVKQPIEKLKFTRPEAKEKWFEEAKREHLKDWQTLVSKTIAKR